MIRETILKGMDQDPEFAWRGGEVTRVENLSDIVFALALGMLVSSRSDVATFSDLTSHLIDIVPIAAGFAIMLMIWNVHFVFFRRYGLADMTVIFLNSCLLLFILFIAYPLRFIFDSFFYFLIGLTGNFERLEQMEVGYTQSGIILGYFSAGYIILFVILSLMYGHALRNAAALGLSDAEKNLTRQSLWILYAQIFCGALVFVGAVLTPLRGFAGNFFVLMWPLSFFIERRFRVPVAKVKN